VSDLSEKLAPAPARTAGRARASLSQLRLMWSEALEVRDRQVVRVALGWRQVWSLVHGRGESAVYELQQSEKEGE
jgi:hypothetical protein